MDARQALVAAGETNAEGRFRLEPVAPGTYVFDFEDIADKQYRGISWGVDGAGRGVTMRYRYKF
jgi:hypothetical protein